MSYLVHVNTNETVPVQLFKDGDTLVAKTRIELSGQRVLTITTRRHTTYRDLRTIASVSQVGDSWERHLICGDFIRTLATSAPARITSKATSVQHEGVLKTPRGLAQLKESIEQFYKAKDTQQDDSAAANHQQEVRYA